MIPPSNLDAIADEYLWLAAETVRDASACEGALRMAIGRAYYAVFLTARDRLFGPDGGNLTGRVKNQLEREFDIRVGRPPHSHEVVILAIAQLKPTPVIKPLPLAQQMGQLKDARGHADYSYAERNLRSVSASSWRQYAEQSVSLASQLLPVVRRLPPYP